MIINCDARALEIVCAAYLSGDPLLRQELIDGVDIHARNQKAFSLPEGKEGRLIAKVAVFRILYGGTEYSFAQDADFASVSTKIEYWKRVIESFYNKYKGLHAWHIKILQEATTTGKLVMPTGREYSFSPIVPGKWPETQIKNFPVQGFGADIMAVIRVAFYKRFMARKIEGKLISSVHDSIVVDAPPASLDAIVVLFNEVFNDGPKLFQQWFNAAFPLPLRCEISYGPNMLDLVEP